MAYLTPKNETLVTRTIVFFVLYFFLRSIVKRGAKQAAKDAIIEGDVNSLIAVELRQAMNPTGTAWFMSFDGTDTEALFNSARKIKDFQAVSVAYISLYDSDLLSDLQNELSIEDFQKFQSLIGKGGATGKYYAKMPVNAFEVLNVDLSKDPIGSIGNVYRSYQTGDLIDAYFVQELGKGSATGSTYLLFKETQFWFFDTYFVIEAQNLLLR